MKFLITILTAIMLGMTQAVAQTDSDDAKIRQLVKEFTKAGDSHNSNRLDEILDDHYRIVLNRQFGSEQVAVVDKTVYLQKIKAQEWGGDSRKIEIDNLIINGFSANAKITFMGEKLTFVSLMQFVKQANNQWKIVGEIPMVQ